MPDPMTCPVCDEALDLNQNSATIECSHCGFSIAAESGEQTVDAETASELISEASP